MNSLDNKGEILGLIINQRSSASKAALDKITIDLGHTVQGTDVMINMTDPGWCRTDLGGIHAPNAPESAIPGIVVVNGINVRWSNS